MRAAEPERPLQEPIRGHALVAAVPPRNPPALGWGIILESAALPEAIERATQLSRAGIATTLLHQGLLRPPPRPVLITRLEFTRRGLKAELAEGGDAFSVSWSQLILVAAAVIAPSSKAAPGDPPTAVLDILTENPARRLRVDTRKFDFSSLPGSAPAEPLRSLMILCGLLLRRAPSADRNHGARLLFKGARPHEFGYASLEDLEREFRWILALRETAGGRCPGCGKEHLVQREICLHCRALVQRHFEALGAAPAASPSAGRHGAAAPRRASWHSSLAKRLRGPTAFLAVSVAVSAVVLWWASRPPPGEAIPPGATRLNSYGLAFVVPEGWSLDPEGAREVPTLVDAFALSWKTPSSRLRIPTEGDAPPSGLIGQLADLVPDEENVACLALLRRGEGLIRVIMSPDTTLWVTPWERWKTSGAFVMGSRMPLSALQETRTVPVDRIPSEKLVYSHQGDKAVLVLVPGAGRLYYVEAVGSVESLEEIQRGLATFLDSVRVLERPWSLRHLLRRAREDLSSELAWASLTAILGFFVWIFRSN